MSPPVAGGGPCFRCVRQEEQPPSTPPTGASTYVLQEVIKPGRGSAPLRQPRERGPGGGEGRGRGNTGGVSESVISRSVISRSVISRSVISESVFSIQKPGAVAQTERPRRSAGLLITDLLITGPLTTRRPTRHRGRARNGPGGAGTRRDRRC